MLNVQLNTELSNIEMRKLASSLNKATGTRLLEKGFNQKFNAAGKTLQDSFPHSVVNFATTKGKTEEQKHVIHCKNLVDLTNKVLLDRDYSYNHFVKLRIVGGESFLKMSFAVVKVTNESDETSSS